LLNTESENILIENKENKNKMNISFASKVLMALLGGAFMALWSPLSAMCQTKDSE